MLSVHLLFECHLYNVTRIDHYNLLIGCVQIRMNKYIPINTGIHLTDQCINQHVLQIFMNLTETQHTLLLLPTFEYTKTIQLVLRIHQTRITPKN